MSENDTTFFGSIMTGLNEALEYTKGNLPSIKRRKVSISPVPKYNAGEIKAIRSSLNLSQMVFAEAVGVSVKTVEAWESGRNKPRGPASRLLQLLEKDHQFLKEHEILSV